MTAPTDGELADAFTAATRSAVSALFAQFPDERFYYLSLILSDPCLPPALTAMSDGFLARARAEDPDDAYLKWDYSRSPVYPYGWDDHYARARRLLELRPDLTAIQDEDAWDAEHRARLAAMEAAVSRLDAEGLFGTADRRAGLVVGVEVMPPDEENTARVRRLNPPEALREWLAEAAEQAAE